VKHPALAVVCACALFSALSAHIDVASGRPTLGEARAAQTELDCVRFEKTQAGKRIELLARSACEKKLSCTLGWVVRCEDRDGKASSISRQSTRFELGAQSTQNLTLSAESCSQAWTIDSVEWNCR
jgi:hypothetical protein